MEGPPKNHFEEVTNPDQRVEAVTEIKQLYASAAETFFDEGDPLRVWVISYFAIRPGVDDELMHVLKDKSETEVASYVQAIKDLTKDGTQFVERMEKIHERLDVHNHRKELRIRPRRATDEEYELGVYTDFLESQVRDAVVIAHKKGYRTFQSGFKEKNERDQFMDFYNRNVSVSETFVQKLKTESIELRIQNLDDRTTVVFHPIGDSPIRLQEWKRLWDEFAEDLPVADGEMVPDMKNYNEHTEFRKTQDLLKQNEDLPTTK